MSDETVVAATPSPEAAAATGKQEAYQDQSILAKSDSTVVSEGKSVLDTAGAEQKAQQESENKRILETPDEKLTAEEKTAKATLIKDKEAADAKALAEEKKKGVPEKYQIKLADGKIVSDADMTKVTPVFKELGLTQAQAQGLTDYYAKLVQEGKVAEEAKLSQWKEASIKETMEALGKNAKSELAAVAKVKNLLSQETIDALNASGIGNLKHFILDMAKIGKMFSEEKIVDGKKAVSASEKSAAEVLYPNMAKE
jgi:hypothetical protein